MSADNYPIRRRPARCAVVPGRVGDAIILLTLCSAHRRAILARQDSVVTILGPGVRQARGWSDDMWSCRTTSTCSAHPTTTTAARCHIGFTS